MYLFRKIILWLIPIFWIAGLELMKEHQQWWWLIGLILLLQQIVTIFFVCKFKFNKNLLHFLILPLLFSMSSWLFLVFIVNALFFHIVVVLSGLVLYFLIHQYYLYFYIPFRYQPYSLESMSLYISLLSAFFLFSSGFGGLILLQLNVWLLSLGLFLSMSLITYQYFWINKFDVKKNWLFILVIVLVLVEVFVSVSFLPTGYYVNGFASAVAFYVMLGLSKHYLSETFNKKRIYSFLAVGGLCLLVVLISAQWG